MKLFESNDQSNMDKLSADVKAIKGWVSPEEFVAATEALALGQPKEIKPIDSSDSINLPRILQRLATLVGR